MEKIYTWAKLNKALRKTKREDEVRAMLEAEQKGGKRNRWIRRIYSRYSRLRRKREKKEVTV